MQRSILLLIFICISLNAVFCFREEEKYVETMTNENYTDIVQSFDPIIIKFYSPLCGISKSLAMDYATVGETMTNEKVNLPFFQVDATVEDKAAEYFGITKYPEIVLVVDKQILHYGNQYTQEKMVHWIKEKLFNPSEEVKEIEQLEEIKKNNQVVITYFGQNDEQYKTFTKVARLNEIFKFTHTFSMDITNHYKIASTPALVIFKQYDDLQNIYTEKEFELKELLYFLEDNAFPAIQEVNQQTFAKVIRSEKPSLFLFLNKQKHNEEQKELEKIKLPLKKDILIFVSEINKKDEKEFAQFFGIKAKHLPMICILEVSDSQIKKYQMSEEINSENIGNFVKLWKLGKLNYYLKSEDIPEDDDDESVQKIVGKTFTQIVMDDEKDIIVNYCSRNQKLCRTLNPIYERIAERFRNNKKLIFGSYDVDENQNENVTIRRTPKIILYPAGKKDSPIEFQNDERTEITIMEFIKSNLEVEEEKKEDL